MKFNKIFWGIGFILLAIALLLNAFGVLTPISSAIGEVSIFTALLGILLFAAVITFIAKGRFDQIFVPISLIFMLFEKNIAILCDLDSADVINNWLLFGCACLIQTGVNLLFYSGRHKKIKHRKCRRHSSSLSSTIKYIDAEGFGEEYVESELGSCVIRFENPDKYTGGGVLHVENDLGSMVIEVPSSWTFTYDIDNSLGSVSADRDGGNPDGPLLRIEGENNLGAMSIEYV